MPAHTDDFQSRRRPFGDIGNVISTQTREDKKQERSTALWPSPRVDEKHRSNAQYPVDYVKDIIDHFRRAELKNRPSSTYMNRVQSDVNDKMRTILIDWLVDVHLKFKLQPETLFLAVEIVDRFLDKRLVSRQKLQLVGVVAMLLAAKYEEIFPPEVKDFIYISANTYTRDEILRMERLMFQTLDFNLTIPTLQVFLKRGLQVVDSDNRTAQLAHYLAELSLLDYKMLTYLPSLIAASCIYSANQILMAKETWGRSLEHYSSYKAIDLERCTRDILQLVHAAPSQKTQAVRRKYSYAKYGEVSKLVQLEHIPRSE